MHTQLYPAYGINDWYIANVKENNNADNKTTLKLRSNLKDRHGSGSIAHNI